MRVLLRSTFAVVAIAATSSLTVAIAAAPETPAAPTVSHQVRLAAAAPPPGALLETLLQDQVQNCSAICPFIIQGAVTIPVAAVRSPLVLVDALSKQPPLQAIGTAAASVTQAADDAVEGIITNDLNLVLPQTQRALEVAVVEAFNIGSTLLTAPAQTREAVAAGRSRILTALNQPLGPPRLPTGATTPLEIAAVRAIEIASAVTFQVPEILLLGAVRAANTAATTLSSTGSIPATISATGASLASTVAAATTAIRTAVTSPITATQSAVDKTTVPAARAASTSVGAKRNQTTKPVSRVKHRAPSGRGPTKPRS